MLIHVIVPNAFGSTLINVSVLVHTMVPYRCEKINVDQHNILYHRETHSIFDNMLTTETILISALVFGVCDGDETE